MFRGWFVQWDLVCDREYLKDLSQTILVVGVIFGAMVFTSLSDHLGRKPVFLFTQWALAVVGVANAFVANYHAFLALRFCTGALQQVYKECARKQRRRRLAATTLYVEIPGRRPGSRGGRRRARGRCATGRRQTVRRECRASRRRRSGVG